MHGAARPCREDPAIDQCQSCVELLGEIGRPAAVIGESGHSRQSILIPVLPPEARLHSPNGQERPRRDAVALLDGCTERNIGFLERAPARDDDRAATLSEKLIERQMEAPLTTVSRDGCSRIGRRHEGCDRGGADPPCPRFIGELLLPRLEASRRAAALRGARFAGHPHERRQGCDRDCLELPALSHSDLLSQPLHQTRRWLAIPAEMRRDRRLSRPSRSVPFIPKCSRAAQQSGFWGRATFRRRPKRTSPARGQKTAKNTCITSTSCTVWNSCRPCEKSGV